MPGEGQRSVRLLRTPLSFPVAKPIEQVLDGPICAFGGELIGRGAVLPDAVANRGGGIGLQLWLGQQSAQVTGQRIAAAALGEKRIARAVEEKAGPVSADQGLVTFQYDPGVAEMFGQFAQGIGTISLDLRRRTFQ